MIKRYVLIDGENLKPGDYSGIDKLTKNDTVVIFESKYSESSVNWKLLYKIKQKRKDKPNIIHSYVDRDSTKQEKNKMDCYMIAHILELITEQNKFKNKFKNIFKASKTEYSIISKDKGFNNYIEYFKTRSNITVFRFDNVNNLHNHYNKKVTKKIESPIIKKEDSDKINDDKSKAMHDLLKEIENLKEIIYDLNDKAENKNINNYNIDNLVNRNNISFNELILKEEVCSSNEYECTLNNTSNLTNSSNDIDSKIIHLSNFRNHKNQYLEEINTAKSIALDTKNENKVYNTKSFDKINLTKFIEDYNNYPKKKKLLRDGAFIEGVFRKHNLYDKYNEKALGNFIKDCDNGLINIKTMSKRLTSSFPENAIKDFKPALNEIIKYQIENNIM